MTYHVSEPIDADVDLVRRYGGAVSHAVLDTAYQTLKVNGIPGFLGFRVLHSCAVALGNPICAEHHQLALAAAFLDFSRNNGYSTVFAVSSRTLADFVCKNGGGAIEFGQLLLGNPMIDPEEGPNGGHLRTSVRFPLRNGVTVRIYDGNGPIDHALENSITQASKAWLSHRRGFQLHIGSHHFFNHRSGCRWLVAEHDGHVVGVLSMLQMGEADCYHLIDLVFSTPDAPKHTNELLIVQAYKQLRMENAAAVCLGVAPRLQLGETIGFSGFATFLARNFYALTNKLAPQSGKATFWEKFGVVERIPLYLAFPDGHISTPKFRARLETFNYSFASARPRK